MVAGMFKFKLTAFENFKSLFRLRGPSPSHTHNSQPQPEVKCSSRGPTRSLRLCPRAESDSECSGCHWQCHGDCYAGWQWQVRVSSVEINQFFFKVEVPDSGGLPLAVTVELGHWHGRLRPGHWHGHWQLPQTQSQADSRVNFKLKLTGETY